MKWTHENTWKLKELYEDPDVSVSEIAKFFSVSKTAIYTQAHANLIKRGSYLEQGYIKCCKCKAVLEFDKFSKNRTTKSGHNNVCKECMRKMRGCSKTRKRFTDNEKNYIIKNYKKLGPKVIGEQLGVKSDSIRRFVARQRKKGIEIGLRREHGKDTRRQISR